MYYIALEHIIILNIKCILKPSINKCIVGVNVDCKV